MDFGRSQGQCEQIYLGSAQVGAPSTCFAAAVCCHGALNKGSVYST